MLALARSRKKTAKTRANDYSSRSHTVMQFSIISCPRDLAADEDPKYYLRSSKINFIDLSGAERGVTQEARHKTVEEGNLINKSLFALSKCINTLARQVKGAYIPYRESKLTRILKDSLGGMTKTTMICHISPCFSRFKESAGTLKYAELARMIPVANQENMKQYKALHGDFKLRIAEDMKKEVAKWKAKTEKRSASPAKESAPAVRPAKADQLVARLKVICEDQLDIRKNLCDVEAQNKLNEVLSSKEKDLLSSGEDTDGLLEMFEELKHSSSQNEYIRSHLLKQLEESNQEIDSLMRLIYDEIGHKAGRQVYEELIQQKEEQIKRLEMETNLKLYEELNSLLIDKVVGMNTKINTMSRQQTKTLTDTHQSDLSRPDFGTKNNSKLRSDLQSTNQFHAEYDHNSDAKHQIQGTNYSKQERTIIEENDEGSENMSQSLAKNTSSQLANHTFSPDSRLSKQAEAGRDTIIPGRSRQHYEFEFDTFKHQTKTQQSDSDNVFNTTSHDRSDHAIYHTDDSRPDNVVEINDTAIRLDKNDKKKIGRPMLDSSVSVDASVNMDSTAQKFHEVMKNPDAKQSLDRSSLKPIVEIDESKAMADSRLQEIPPGNSKKSSQKMKLEHTGYSSLDSELVKSEVRTEPSDMRKTNFRPAFQSEDSGDFSIADRQTSVRLPASAYHTMNSLSESRHITPVDMPALMAGVRRDAGQLLLSNNMQDDFLDRLPVDMFPNPDRMTAIKFGMEGEQTVRWNLNVGWGEEYKVYEGVHSESYPETGCVMEGELMLGEKDFMTLLDPEELLIFEDLTNKTSRHLRNPLKRVSKGKQPQGLPEIPRNRSTSREKERSADRRLLKQASKSQNLPSVSNKLAIGIKEVDIKFSSDSNGTNTANRLPTIQAGSKQTLTDGSIDQYADSSARGHHGKRRLTGKNDQLNIQITN